MYCDSCDRKYACELHSHVCEHEVEFCKDYVDMNKIEWRADWFEASKDECGEYNPDDFEW